MVQPGALSSDWPVAGQVFGCSNCRLCFQNRADGVAHDARLPPVVAASGRNLETPECVQFDGRNRADPVTITHTTHVTEMPQLRRRQGLQPPKRQKYAQKLTNHVDKAAEERGCRQLYVCNFVFELCRSHDCRAAVL